MYLHLEHDEYKWEVYSTIIVEQPLKRLCPQHTSVSLEQRGSGHDQSW